MEAALQLVPPAPPAEPLGARMLRARKWAQLRQVDIAKKLGVSHRTVWSWEHDEKVPGFDKVVLWADATGFPVAWFAEGLSFEVPVTAGSLEAPKARGTPPLAEADDCRSPRSRRPGRARFPAGSPGGLAA